MSRITVLFATLALAVSPLLVGAPATAGRGGFPHPQPGGPGGGPIRCIQAPCPLLPTPADRGDFPHPGGGQVKCFKAPCPRIPGIVRG